MYHCDRSNSQKSSTVTVSWLKFVTNTMTGVTWDFLPHEFPPPPRIKYHMVKVPHLWDFSPPPQSHMLSQYYIWNLGWRRFAIEGEGLPYGIISPWGSSAIGFLPFAVWYNLRGDNLPWYLFPHHESCVGGGGGGFTIEGEALPYGIVPPMGNFYHGISSGGRFAIWYSFRGNVCHMA